jgi:membrane protease YdiL (CAAX protease family)
MAVVIAAVLLTVMLHFGWEMLQAPAFTRFADGAWTGTSRCFKAALGDLLIASGAYAVTALLFRRSRWAVLPAWRFPAT